jgi:hypothetical protein
LVENSLHGQISKAMDYPNFFGLKRQFDPDTLLDFEQIKLADRTIAFRHFFPNQKIVESEYLNVAEDTFLLIKYLLPHHAISAQGKVIPSICCAFKDSVYTFNPETYEEQLTLERYLDWSKEGAWKYDNTQFHEYGYYKNNVKIGEWYHWDKNTQRGSYHTFDTLGNLLNETPQNKLDTYNKDTISNGILGSWEIFSMNGSEIALRKSNPQMERGYYGTLFFTKDQVRIKPNIQCGTGLDVKSIKKRFNNIWSLDDSMTLYLNVYGFENQKYKITYLDRQELRLLRIE